MKKLFLLLAVFGVMFSACEEGLDKNEENDDGASIVSKIELAQQNVEVDFEPAEYEVKVTSPYSWDATSKNDWIVVESETGIAGEEVLKFSVKRNEEEKVRKGTITLKNSDYNLIAELYVIQKAFVPIIEYPESLTFAVAGGTQEVTITANFDYVVTADKVDWLTIEKSESGIKVTVEPTDIVEERTAEITISSEKYNLSKSIKVTQGAFVPEITITPESLTFEGIGGTQEVTITANFDYKITADKVDWFIIEETESGIKVTVEPTDFVKERTAEITISSEKYNLSKKISILQEVLSKDATNIILYTSSDGNCVTPYMTNAFGAAIVNNEYKDGRGIITFDAPVTVIAEHAFSGCSSLTSIIIPYRVTSIGGDAFSGCSSLTSITIGDRVTSIGNYAFSYCSSLTSITIPYSVTSIGRAAFSGCNNLKSFYGKFASDDNRCLIVNGELNSFAPANLTSYAIPYSVTSIGSCAFISCSSLTSVTIPDRVTSIGSSAFSGCSSLTSVTIPDSVTSIGGGAFSHCNSLTSVTIGDSVTSIGGNAFRNCSSLTSVTIPDSVASIGQEAFYGCSSLTSVYCKPTTPPTGGEDMFKYYNNGYRQPIDCKIYVPRNSVSAYKSAQYWSEYASNIVGYNF